MMMMMMLLLLLLLLLHLSFQLATEPALLSLRVSKLI
jgi:hypothetical protein